MNGAKPLFFVISVVAVFKSSSVAKQMLSSVGVPNVFARRHGNQLRHPDFRPPLRSIPPAPPNYSRGSNEQLMNTMLGAAGSTTPTSRTMTRTPLP
eukprot:2897993-Pyramimonas_sp.AAC.1